MNRLFKLAAAYGTVAAIFALWPFYQNTAHISTIRGLRSHSYETPGSSPGTSLLSKS
jgi:hypothetical protein